MVYYSGVGHVVKLGLISDIHGNPFAFKEVLAALSDAVDQILFMGDISGYYPFVDECLAMWDDAKMVGVRGNHDQVLLNRLDLGEEPTEDYRNKYGSALDRATRSLSGGDLSIIKSWPLERRLSFDSTSLAIYHGAPWDRLDGRVYPDFDDWARFESCVEDVIILGHTHYPMTKRWKEKLIVNPGSVGQSRDGAGGACFAELEVSTGQVIHHRVAYETEVLISDARRYSPELSYLEEVLR